MVLDIGLCGTEGSYLRDVRGGPRWRHHGDGQPQSARLQRNEFVREQSRPISGDTGLFEMRSLVQTGNLPPKAARAGTETRLDTSRKYLDHLLGYVDRAKLRKLKVVVNAGNGGAGLIVDQLEPHLPFEFIKVNHQPDGTFPNGVPNPMLLENQASTADVIRRTGADVGLAWDGDYDRCFFFDEHGQFIEGYYLVGLLAEAFLKGEPGGRIVHDPRLTWNTIDIVRRCGGEPVLCKSGTLSSSRRCVRSTASMAVR